jgi:lipase
MANYTTSRVLSGRVMLNVYDFPGDDPPVLFLHGFTANGIAALRIGNFLAYRRRVIAPDLRGRGNSDTPFSDYGMNTHITDVLACMDRLGVQKFVAAGHSFGAAIAVHLAAKHPDRVSALMLFDGGAPAGEAASQVLNYYYSTLTYEYANIDDYIARFKGAPTYSPWTDELEALVRSNLTPQPDGTYIRKVARYVVDTERSPEAQTAWQQLPELHSQITCPVLIIRAGMGMIGTEDQVLTDAVIDSMRFGTDAVEVVTVPEAGHTTLLTMPSEVRDEAILRFLGL